MRTTVVFFSILGLAGCGLLAPIPADSDPSIDAGASDGKTSGSATTAPRDAGAAKVDAGIYIDAGAHRSTGRCAKDADCAPDGRCVELAPGGYRVCTYPPPAPRVCTNDPNSHDECCDTCASGACTLVTSCGGAYIEPHNVCAIDACAVNADCGDNGVCLPTGVGSAYARTCLTSNECVRHSDCVAAPDGVCALIGMIGELPVCAPWSCPGSATQLAYRLACVYGSECAADEDCPKGHCEKVGGRPTCMPGVRAVCPPPP